MFKNLHLTTKVFLILAPLLVVTFAVVIYSTFRFQERQVLQLAQLAAESQAATIKRSLVHMMQTQEEVDDAYLRQISSPGELENVQILFRLDSLGLLPSYLTPRRVEKLRRREASVAEKVSMYATEVYTEMRPLWIMSCDISQHANPADAAPDFPMSTLEGGIPSHFWSCGRLKVVEPFLAERKCLQCHNVSPGSVLGAASMEIPIGRTVSAIRQNAIRSIAIFFVLSGAVSILAIFIFRRFVSKPVDRLIEATRRIGQGKKDEALVGELDNDEFGQLARSFDEMQALLEQARTEIINRERLSTIGQLASSIIHDFRNPMTNISVGLGALESQHDMPAERRAELFRIIRDSIDRMSRMTQELLEFARGETRLELAEVELGEFARKLETHVRPHLERHGIGFTVEAVNGVSCTMDGDRMERCLINLINNAEDVLTRGGRISIGIRRKNGIVCFEVRDNGPGIPEAVRDRIFEPFVTMGKPKGTGLGLAITKRVIEQHGGNIGFRSEPQKGTTFEIVLPAGPAR